MQELKARLPAGAAAMTVRVKICGINDPAAFDTAIAAGADWVGFNFFPPSPRYVTPAQAADLSARSPGWTAARRAVRRSDAGRRSPRRSTRCGWTSCSSTARWTWPALRARFGLPIWRAVGVRPPTISARSHERRRPAGGGGKAAARRDAARRQRRALRLVAAARLERAGALDSCRRPDRGQRRRGHPHHGCIGGRCVLGRRGRARRQGSGADPRLHRRSPPGGSVGEAIRAWFSPPQAVAAGSPPRRAVSRFPVPALVSPVSDPR